MNEGSPLVSTGWLAERLGQPNIRIADASWYLPQAGRNALAEYKAAHIPGAVYFDLDAVSDRESSLPHMLPDADAFASSMKRLGIDDTDLVVFYDGAGIFSSPRGRWMMLAMGHSNAVILDGGFPKWLREGRPTESGEAAQPPRADFTPRPQPQMVRDFDAVKANLQTKTELILDARSGSRFRGEEVEPRPGVRPGHIPGAVNLHYADVVTSECTMRSAGELKNIFTERGISPDKPVVTSCGSGVTAAILSLALEIFGASNTSLYDGSWAEWGARMDAPVETGR